MDPMAADILTFWFETTDLNTDFDKRAVWFRATPEFDEQMIARYTGIHEQAAAGALDHFKTVPKNVWP